MAESPGDPLLQQLRQNVDAEPSNPAHHYNLGLYLWKQVEKLPKESDESKNCKAAAAKSFLATAKLNPHDGSAFCFLGHYYATSDVARATKCYQRAVLLNPNDSEAGEGICELLDQEGKETLEVAVCKEAAEKSPRAFWAFRRLGYLLVHQKKWSEAIQSLQHAIRGYPSCADLWEALGLAYQRLGMLTAAIKSYGRAVELEGNKIFALIESGNIHVMLGHFREGVELFHCAVKLAPDNLSACSGLASAMLGWARSCVISGAYSWAASLLEEALKAATECTSLSGNQYSLWKLLGDIQMAYAKCFPWHCNKSELDENTFKDSILGWKRQCLLAACSAKLSYQRALHLTPWQANLYNDAAISLDLICSLQGSVTHDSNVWRLAEKMSLGGLLLEPSNKEFWVTLGSLSIDHASKQHFFIRGLQLDQTSSKAWAYLGKLYRSLGDSVLASSAFDRARSIDPSLALPWAGMSADNKLDISTMDAFESCLRAVQILPLAEFQVGLGMTAYHSGNLRSPQVLAAIEQAVGQAPSCPESHNVNGLVYEARSDYPSAVASYRRARYALEGIENSAQNRRSHFADISFNLARSLCKAGLAIEAVDECESLKAEDLLGTDGLQIYALAMYKVGKYSETLVLVRDLARHIASMDLTAGSATLALIVALVYNISGKDPAAAVIQKFPTQLMQPARMHVITYALCMLNPTKRFPLPSLHSAALTSTELVTEVHRIIALGKTLRLDTSSNLLRFGEGISYLKKVLHLYPHSSLLRNELNYLLLCGGSWMAPHELVPCNVPFHQQASSCGLKLQEQVQGAAAFACYSSVDPKFSFSNCVDQFMHSDSRLTLLQSWIHREPWNKEARYLLAINLLQKARAENYPFHMCTLLKRLILQFFSSFNNLFSDSRLVKHMAFLLLLSQSEIYLQCGDVRRCIYSATKALGIGPQDADSFFAHLQLCRVYVIQKDFENAANEYNQCLKMNVTREIGWVVLKYMQFLNESEDFSDQIELNFRSSMEVKGSSTYRWAGIFSLACAQCYLWNHDYESAEQALSQTCEGESADSCILLLHGAICLVLAKQFAAPQYISRAAGSLRKAQKSSGGPLPLASLLLAQVEGSLGSKARWERNLRLEWDCWPQACRPAELYFQMHLLAKQSAVVPSQNRSVEALQRPENWLLQAIHLNPSTVKYWKALHDFMGY